MATMTIVINNIERIQPAGRSNCDDIKIDCNISLRDMEDIIAQCCEQMGEKEFSKYVSSMLA